MSPPLKCPRCEAEITSSSRFCLKCGENVSYITKRTYQTPPPSSVSGPGSSVSGQAEQGDEDLKKLKDELSKLTFDQNIKNEQILSSIRERLTAWADAIPHHGIKNFGSVISISSVTELKNYLIKLNSTIESRSAVKERTKPYENEQIPQTPLLKQKIENVWDFKFPPSRQKPMVKEEFDIAQSFRKQKCVDCRGEGSLFCMSCRKEKIITCPACEGQKRTRCGKCRGTGKVNCRTCGAKGELSLPDSGGKKTKCFDCQGYGFFKCTECEGGYNSCGTCSSTGVIGCPECRGAGSNVCNTCKGKGAILNYLSFESVLSVFSATAMIRNPALPKIFPVQDLLEHQDKVKILSLDFKSSSPKISLSKNIHALISQHITQLMTAAFREVEGNPNKHIISQHIDIDRVSVYELAYEFFRKKYTAYLFGKTGELYIEDNPITDMQSDWINQAQQAFNTKNTSQTLRYISKVLQIEPLNVKALSLLQAVKRRHSFRMKINALVGACIGGALMIGLILFFKHKSLNYLIPCLQTGAVSLLIGYLLGLGIAFVTTRKMRIINVRKRVPFFVSLGTVTALFLTIIFGFRYDPIYAKDSEQFTREFNKALPYGIPAVPWEDDIKFLEKLVKKFKPTGIDINKAEKGLAKLKKLKLEKKREEAKKKKRASKRREKSSKQWKSQRAKKKYQAAFDKEMVRYENLIIQKTLKTKDQKINFISKLINLYKYKGINIRPAEIELTRLRKIKIKKKVKRKRKRKKKVKTQRKSLGEEVFPDGKEEKE